MLNRYCETVCPGFLSQEILFIAFYFNDVNKLADGVCKVKIMVNQLYLGYAFGWDTESIAKVAICQLREKNLIAQKCPKAQLIRNEYIRQLPNILKIFGYIPVINVIAGAVAIAHAFHSDKYSPNNAVEWRERGVAMIFCGPILLVVDLIVHLYHLKIANQYSETHTDLIEAFNVTHKHTKIHLPAQQVRCLIEPEVSAQPPTPTTMSKDSEEPLSPLNEQKFWWEEVD